MFPAKRSTKLAFPDITELKNLTDGHGLLRATDREVSLINKWSMSFSLFHRDASKVSKDAEPPGSFL